MSIFVTKDIADILGYAEANDMTLGLPIVNQKKTTLRSSIKIFLLFTDSSQKPPFLRTGQAGFW